MPWSISQNVQVERQNWLSASGSCPGDNAPLKLKLHKFQGGDYNLRIAFPVCGKRKEFRRGDDPLRHRFHRWTTDEVRPLSESTAQIAASPCRVCTTPLETHPAPALVTPRCFRRGNS